MIRVVKSGTSDGRGLRFRDEGVGTVGRLGEEVLGVVSGSKGTQVKGKHVTSTSRVIISSPILNQSDDEVISFGFP